MSNARITYLGAGETTGADAAGQGRTPIWRRVPKAFLLLVALPTLISAVYLLVFATPAYVSESKFVVRERTREQPSSLGIALQGVGITSTQTDAFIVHEYMDSHTAVGDLSGRLNLPAVLGRPGVDFISRFPRPLEGTSPDAARKALKRYINVTYDSQSGISTLRVKAFRPEDSQTIALTLLDGGERLINQLNERANAGAVSEASRELAEAESRLTSAQVRLTAFRNREQLIDPTRVAAESTELVGTLLGEVARMRAERSQIARAAPESPQLTILDARIAAFEAQVATERARIAGTAQSLAPKLANYESLALEREYAEKAVATAHGALRNAQIDSRRQQIYLDRIVPPNLPTDASEPRRWRILMTIFISLLVVYGLGSLIVAGLREHNQA